MCVDYRRLHIRKNTVEMGTADADSTFLPINRPPLFLLTRVAARGATSHPLNTPRACDIDL
jgi:hypothetical protein